MEEFPLYPFVELVDYKDQKQDRYQLTFYPQAPYDGKIVHSPCICFFQEEGKGNLLIHIQNVLA